jgi:site-specific recombinase XerD
MSSTELIEAHHVDQLRRGLLPSSIQCRDDRLRLLARWLGERTLLEATTDDLQLFLDERKLSARTRYAWLSHVHSFFVWAMAEELVERDPTVKIVRPKLRRALPRPANTEELVQALAMANPEQRCWVLLASLMGLRCQEIAGLTVDDVLDGEGLLRVTQAKGGKERILPMHPDVRDALHALPMPRAGHLFLRPMRQDPYDGSSLSRRMNQFLREANVHATAHQLRHWFGTNLYNTSHDIRLTQEMLGHASPSTTAIYTAFDQAAAAEAMRSMSLKGSANGGATNLRPVA